MATLTNNNSGDFSNPAVWFVVNPASLLDTEVATVASTTAFVGTNSFTIAAMTSVDGIGLKISVRTNSATGGFSVQLFSNTTGALVPGTTVGINVADLVVNPQGWVFFPFSTAVTLLAGTSYSIQMASTSSSQVTVYRSATAGALSSYLRTTVSQAPVAGDVIYINGTYSLPGTSTVFTIQYTNTTTIAYGKIEIGSKGILNFPNSPATNFYLKMTDSLYVNGGASLRLGTSLFPMPASSTVSLEFSPATNVAAGLIARGQYDIQTYGAVKTGRAYLALSASVSATNIVTDISTGWKSGDQIALASTTRAIIETESKLLTGDAVGTSIPVAAVTYAHSGVAPTRAEVINLTRNIKIFGQSVTLQAFINLGSLGNSSFNYNEIFFMGSASFGKRGIDITSNTGSCIFNGCAIRNFEVSGSYGMLLTSPTNTTTINDCVFYRTHTAAIQSGAGANTLTVTNCWALTSIGGAYLMSFQSTTGTFTDLTCVSAAVQGFNIAGDDYIGAIYTNLTAHSCGSSGMNQVGNASVSTPLLITNTITWANNSKGIYTVTPLNCIMDGITSFSNTLSGLEINGNFNCVYKNLSIYAGIPAQPVGVILGANSSKVTIDNGVFGISGVHSGGDVSVATPKVYHDVVFRNCFFNSPSDLVLQTRLLSGSTVGASRVNSVAGAHKMWKTFGTLSSDSAFFFISSPSLRLTPNNLTNKLTTQEKTVAVPLGKTIKISAYIRKSVVGDGTAYNGNQPRLVLIGDPSTGIPNNTVIATSTIAGNGAFELVTGTTVAVTDNCVLKFNIDCDGTAGWINIDRWSVEVI